MRKKTRHYPLIYVRYIFPVIANLSIIAFLFIPNMRFTLDSDVRQSMSIWELIKNTWYNSRVYLFSSQSQQTNDGALFYKAVFITLIVCVILFLVGTFFTAFATMTTIRYYNYKDEKIRNIYASIVPNRCVMLIFSLTLLPITFFPEMLVYFYKHLLLYPVNVSYKGISAAILSVIIFLLLFAFTFITAKKETSLGLNIFKYGKKVTGIHNENNDETESKASNHYSIDNKKSNYEKLKDLLGLNDTKDNN